MTFCRAHRWMLLVVGLSLLVPKLAASAEWKAVATQLLASEKPGYGGASGVIVHPATGDIYTFLSEKGLYRSTDQGATWRRHGAPLTGRTEWPGSIGLFPGESVDRFVIATVYDGPVAKSADGGKSWQLMDGKSNHVDWCAVAPDDPQTRFVLALKHESGDLLIRSNDGGRTFQDVGKDYGPACVFDEKTAVVLQGESGKRKAVRTTDGGATFEPCADWNTRALPQWRGAAAYWLTDSSIVKSTDKGATWAEVCEIKDGRFGPVFGKTDEHLLVLTSKGIVESRDGGKQWSPPIALPKAYSSNSPLTWLAYDVNRDVLYVAQMGADVFCMKRTE